VNATVTSARATSEGQPRRGTAAAATRPESTAKSTTAAPQTLEAALDRFYKYLEATSGANTGEGRERWQRARQLVEDLRAMGDVGSQALMSVLAGGTDSDERRAAARLLGQLQVPQSLSLLKDVIEKDDDVLLRRAAAGGLRQLQTPESVPVMEHILANPNEDRFVRLSMAYGLAEAGQPQGVAGLTQIFAESTADGRGRDMAFRALAALDDNRALPFMRQVLASQTEPTYRLRAIRYLTVQGDQQSLGTLQAVMNSPNEQPSIRDAAAHAYRTIGGK
jgi:thioredoxin-like negative regulator of GroEL